MTPAQQRAIEKKLGRSLTPREVIFEELERHDNRTLEQRFNYQSIDDWQPVLERPKGPATPFDQAIIEAEKAALAERIAKMSPAERTVLRLKEARAAALAKSESAAAHEARMKSPEVAKPLAALRELRERMRWDVAYGVAEVDAVARAIKQYESPGSDLQVAKQLFIEAFDAEKAIKSSQRDLVLQKMSELGAQKDELDAALEKLNPESKHSPTTNGDESLRKLWFDAVDKMDAAEAAYDALKADAKADPSTVKQARESMLKSLAAVGEAEAAFSASKEVAHAD